MLTQLAVPHLIASKGNIVNVSSICGTRSFEDLLGYCMSKAALDQFTKCTALELIGKGVRVNSVNPGRFNARLHYFTFLILYEISNYSYKNLYVMIKVWLIQIFKIVMVLSETDQNIKLLWMDLQKCIQSEELDRQYYVFNMDFVCLIFCSLNQ